MGDYPGGPDVITRIPVREGRRRSQKERPCEAEMGVMWPCAKECQQLPEGERQKEQILP